MRRNRRSNVRSFTNGLLLAGLPIVAFLGADYLLAPPTSQVNTGFHWLGLGQSLTINAAPTPQHTAEAGLPTTPVLVRQGSQSSTNLAGSLENSQPSHSRAPDIRATQVAFAAPAAARATAPANSLVLTIQQELERVGCYTGRHDGAWNSATRGAMDAFNASVHVSLPTERPDYILLTLLQGHSSKACSSNQLEAKAAPLPIATTPRQAIAKTATQRSWTTTVAAKPKASASREVAASAVVARAPAKTAAAVRPVPSVQVNVSPNGALSVSHRNTAAVATLPKAVGSYGATNAAVPPSQALPGRMAIGVLPPGDTPSTLAALPAALPAPVVVPEPVPAVRPEPVRTRATQQTRSRQTAQRSSRRRNVFQDLSRNSP